MAGQCIDFMAVTNSKYHEKQLEYNMKAMLLVIKKAYPLETNPDFDDPRIIELIKDLPSLPMLAGGIAKELGIDKNIVSLELWRDFSNGYAPANKIPKNSPLRELIIETPRGPMVQFRKNASPINENGDYVLEPIKPVKGKKKRLASEFVFGMSGNISTAIGRLASEDPAYEKKFTDIMNDVIKNHVLPAMLEDALIRTGTDGTQLHYAKELLMVSFNHTERRDELPFYHAHVDLMNVALGYDDKFYTVCTDQIIQNKDHYNAIFQSNMKEMLEKDFGFVFKPVYLAADLENEFLADHERNICSYDLIDEFVPQNVQDFANARQLEMEAAIKAKGKTLSFAEMEHARLETREEKTDLSPAELKAKWKGEYDKLGYTAEHVKNAMKFDQVMPNVARLEDDQMIKNYQRKVNDQAVRKGQSTKYNNQIPKTAQKYADSQLKAMPFPNDEDDSAADERMIAGFIRKHREVSFTETQFKSHMVKQLLETHDKDSAWRKAEQMFNDNCLHMMDKTKLDYFKDFMENKAMDPMDRQQKMIQWAKNMQFTTKSIRNMEMEIFDSLNARKGETHLAYSKQHVSEFILEWEAKKSKLAGKNVKLQDGQRAAVLAAICTTGAVINVAGRAGSGKSFLVECVKDFYETKGVQMFGTSTSSAATAELAQSVKLEGGKFHNTAKLLQLLKTNKISFTKDTIITVDECGMIDMDTMHELVIHANKAGARLLLVGEKEQLQNIGLSSIYRKLNDEFGFTPVTEINRQQDHWQKEVVNDFALGQSAKAVKSLFDHGRVVITKTEDERLKAAVKAYMDSTHMEEQAVKIIGENGKSIKQTVKVEVATRFDQKVMIAATNYDVERLNNEIRSELKKKGELPEIDEAKITCADKVERGFSVKDRVIFTKSTKSCDADPMEVANSQAGTITGFKIDKLTKKPFAIRIMLDNGKEVHMDCKKKNPAIRSAYAITTHKSQGQTRETGFFYVSANMNSLHQAYVACSRHKQKLTMFLSEELGDKLAEKLDDKPPTERMLKVAGWVAKQRGVELTPDITESFTETRAFLNQNYERFDKTGEPEHPTDFFTDIITAMSKTQYKKSTLDYQLLDGEQIKTYEEIQKARKDMLKTPAKITEELIEKVKKDDYVPEYARKEKPASINELPTLVPKVRTPDKIQLIEPPKKVQKKKKEVALTR